MPSDLLPPLLLLPLSGAITALLLPDRRSVQATVALVWELAIIGLVVAVAVPAGSGSILVHEVSGWAPPFGIVLVADATAALFLCLCTFVFICSFLYFFLEPAPASSGGVMALLLLLQLGIHGALLTGDLFDFYVFFEMMGLASYALVAYKRERPHLEAALKFATLSLLGSSFVLVGVGGVYAQTGVLTFAFLPQASTHVELPSLHLLCVGLVLTGLCLKAAMIPLHFWLPDAHSIAPTPVSILLSGAVVKIGAYGVLRLLASQAPWVRDAAGPVLLAAGGGAALLAALAAVGQLELKRLLAYSTGAQMGYVITGLALGTAAGIRAALVFAVAHALAKTTWFAVAGTAIVTTRQRGWREMGGLGARSPWFAAAGLAGALSLAGLPPLAGFTGKLVLFAALFDAGAFLPLLALVLASILMLYLLVRVWLGVFAGSRVQFERTISPPGGHVALCVAAAAATVLVGLGAQPLLRLATHAAAQMTDGRALLDAVGRAASPPPEPT